VIEHGSVFGLFSLNSQIKRRTRVVGLFPGEESLQRLVTAVLVEISET
jgi:transposase-like protein